MNAKIREFGVAKVPFILILGDKEEATESVSVRTRAKGDEGSATLAEFLGRAEALTRNRSVSL